MKHTIYRAILAIVLFTQSFKSNAQQVYVYQINFSYDNVSYDVLMVLYGSIANYDARDYTRTAYYDHENNYNIYNQNWKVESGATNDSKPYFTITGINGYFITNVPNKIYNSDSYTFILNTDKTFNGLPFKSGDANNPSNYVNTFRQLNYSELTYDFLKRFFKEDEPQFSYLLGLNNGAIATSSNATILTALKFVNNTNSKIKASFVYYDNGCACWISRGWRMMADGESNSIDLTKLNIGNNTMYVHAENNFRTWGDDFQFCMNQDGLPLQYADQQKNCTNQKMFFKVHLKNGITTFTFNP